MATFLLLLNSAALGIGLLGSVVLLLKKSRFHPNQYLLAGFLMCFSTSLIKNYYVLDADLIEPLSFLYRVSIPPMLLTAPLMYLLVRNVLNSTSLRRSDALIALPVLIQMVDLIPVYLLESGVKRDLLIFTVQNPLEAFGSVDGLFIPGEWLLPIRAIYSVPFTLLAFRVYWIRRRELVDFADSSKSLSLLGAFSASLALFTVLNSLNPGFLAMSFLDGELAGVNSRPTLYFNIFTGAMTLISITSLVFLYPEILFVLHTQGVSQILDQVQLRETMNKLEALFTGEPMYLDKKLRLTDVAGRLNVDVQTLSLSLNRMKGINFNTYVNRWRVQYARERFDRRDHVRITIGAIAEASGFASRSSFYSAFKTVLGKTPSEYVKELNDPRIPA